MLEIANLNAWYGEVYSWLSVICPVSNASTGPGLVAVVALVPFVELYGPMTLAAETKRIQ